MNPGVLVGVGGAVGAMLRHLVTDLAADDSPPVGTLSVNVVGSFVLGAVTFLDPGNDALLLVGVGACGSFTTFSSFSVDTVRLWETDGLPAAATYAAANLLGSLAAIGLAGSLVSALS